MTKTLRRAAVSVLAASALLLAAGPAAFASGSEDEAFFFMCHGESFASAGPDGAEAGSASHCVVAGAHTD